MRNLLLFAIFSLFLSNCTQDLGYHAAIQGKWKVTNWTTDNGGNRPVESVNFDFHGDTYDAKLGNRDESGSFRLVGDKLYTQAEGQQEIMVKIMTLAADSMMFEMNRGGVREVMTLKRP